MGEPGTPGFRYCDAPRASRSYCAEHIALAYRPPTANEKAALRAPGGSAGKPQVMRRTSW